MMGLAIFHYDFVRVHGVIKMMPAVKCGLTSHGWTVRQVVELAATH